MNVPTPVRRWQELLSNIYDIEKREEKTILEDAEWLPAVCQQRKNFGAPEQNTYAVIKPEENQKFEKPLRIAEMQTIG